MKKKLRDILFFEIPTDWLLRWWVRAWHRVFYAIPRPWTTNQLLVLCTAFVALAYVLGYALGKADGSYARQELEYHVIPLQLENFVLRGRLGIPQFADWRNLEVTDGKGSSTAPAVPPAAMSSQTDQSGAPTVVVGAEEAAASAPTGRGGQVASAPAPGAAGADR